MASLFFLALSSLLLCFTLSTFTSCFPHFPQTVPLNHTATMEAIKDFMAFDATQLLNQTLVKVSSDGEENISIPLYDVNIFLKSKHKDYGSLISSSLSRDAKRVNWLISNSVNSTKINDLAPGTSLPLGYEAGFYVTFLDIGTPPQRNTLIVDTGSDLVWWDCKPCKNCLDSSYDPSRSSTYAQVNCRSSFDCPPWTGWTCDHSDSQNRCKFRIIYLDKSEAQGIMAFERLTYLGASVIDRIKFGCADTGPVSFMDEKSTGTLGFGREEQSFIRQLKATSFSFCPRVFTSLVTTPMYFNRVPNPNQNTVTVPLYLSNIDPTYDVKLNGILIGGEYVKIGPRNRMDRTRAILDSGTRVTRFPFDVYYAFSEVFKRQFTGFPEVPGDDFFDTCYNLNGSGSWSLDVPAVAFHFPVGSSYRYLPLKADQLLYPMDDHGKYCLGFAPIQYKIGYSIIGSFQMTGTRVSIDLQREFVQFDYNYC